MGIHWTDPAHRAAIKSVAMYSSLFGVMAGTVAALSLTVWTEDTAILRRNACVLTFGVGVAWLWFTLLNRQIQAFVEDETAVRPSDALRVLHAAFVGRK